MIRCPEGAQGIGGSVFLWESQRPELWILYGRRKVDKIRPSLWLSKGVREYSTWDLFGVAGPSEAGSSPIVSIPQNQRGTIGRVLD